MAQLCLLRHTQIPGVRIQRYINRMEWCVLSRVENQQFKVILGYRKCDQKRVGGGEDEGRGKERTERGEVGGGRERKIKRGEILLLAKASILSTKLLGDELCPTRKHYL